MKLVAVGLTFLALPAPIPGAGPLPGINIRLAWPSLGPGTTYYVQKSTNLRIWSNAVVTTATSASLPLSATRACVFRLGASNAPRQSSVTVAWKPVFAATNVAGYYLYYGKSTGNYTEHIDAGLNTSAKVENLLPDTTYYFAATSYTNARLESGYSEEMVWPPLLVLSIQSAPAGN